MSEFKDGGPAFPVPGRMVFADPTEPGLTLRDYFAAKSIASVMSRFGRFYNPITVAENCYAMADAMLRARETEE